VTYSIVARDSETGQLGVAVQSHWFSVGSLVPWAQPGVGAVATQANVEVAYGPRALELLAAGADAQAVLAQLVAEDKLADERQVAIVDAAGRAAAHTGASCMAYAGHLTGEGVSCQANIMTSERVWPAMMEAFSSAAGALTERLLATLDAAELAGGDIRGRQSAAILVVPGEGEPWDALISLRVEDHPDPLSELRRLVGLHVAYDLANEADELVAEGRDDEAARLYRKASEVAPESYELRFWAGLGDAQLGDLDGGVREVQAAIAAHPPMRELLERLANDSAPMVAAVLRAIDHKAG
jgi:uncharacterized Ntn-hydrolase superfamily protein